MTAKNKGNPVSDRSKQWMEKTLLERMRTESFGDITIQEITDRAGLSRRTFYRNFSSKEEILKGRIDGILHEYRGQLEQTNDLSFPNVVRILFTVARKHQDFLLLLNRHGLLPLLLAEIDDRLPPAFDAIKGKNLDFPKENIGYALTFASGGFIRILIRWLNGGAVKSPEEMAAVMKDFVALCNYPECLPTR